MLATFLVSPRWKIRAERQRITNADGGHDSQECRDIGTESEHFALSVRLLLSQAPFPPNGYSPAGASVMMSRIYIWIRRGVNSTQANALRTETTPFRGEITVIGQRVESWAGTALVTTCQVRAWKACFPVTKASTNVGDTFQASEFFGDLTVDRGCQMILYQVPLSRGVESPC